MSLTPLLSRRIEQVLGQGILNISYSIKSKLLRTLK